MHKHSAASASVAASELEASISLKRALLPLSDHSDPQRARRCEKRQPQFREGRFRDESCRAMWMQAVVVVQSGVEKKRKKKQPCAPFVRVLTFLDERLNVKSPRKKDRNQKEWGNGALRISTSYTARRFRRLQAEIEPSAALARADSVSVGPHARL